MIKRPTLLVLAAGMATRYGSLKQLDHFGPNGETIIDYSIYDAIKAGFGKVVFVIRESIEDAFKKEMLNKFAGKIEVAFVLQELHMLPEGFSVPENRTKPWGTAHAVWVASSELDTSFAVINADDFYGFEALKLIADHLRTGTDDLALAGYRLGNTLSEHGAVSRGVCEIDDNGYLQSITEQTSIIQTPKGIVAENAGRREISLSGDVMVSMNLMGLTPSVLPYFENYFKEFLKNKSHRGPKVECYLPEVINELVRTDKARVKVLPTSERWFGVTFPEDKPVAIKELKSLISAGVYPHHLWAAPVK